MPEPPPDQTVDPERLEELFAAARELSPAGRAGFLAEVCGDDAALRSALESLLAAAGSSGPSWDGLDSERAAALLDTAEDASRSAAVGPYRLVRELGRGGMGTVYLAERCEGEFEQRVALKLVRRDLANHEAAARFRRERQILARLEDPGIARLLDGGVTGEGRPWFAMELVDGEPITVYCARRQLGVRARLELFVTACDAVQHAHSSLVVHRDLKPSNVLVSTAGRVKLVDFGIARLLEPDGDLAADRVTREGMRALTPAYAAPEQVRGDAVTTATDVYSLGVVLYELLAGRLPYDGPLDSPARIVAAVCDSRPVVPSVAARLLAHGGSTGAPPPRIDRDLDLIVLKALAKEPAQRYGSAEALAADIKHFLAGMPVAARPPGSFYRATRFIGRHRLAVTAAVLAVVALLAGLVGTTWQAAVAAAERDRAAAQAARAGAVQGFLADLLQSGDPWATGGAPPTARDLLDRGVARIDQDLAGEPEVAAELLGVMGGVSRSLGEPERAEQLWRRSLELRREVLAPDDPEIAASLRGVAAALWEQGRYAAAEELVSNALAIARGAPDAGTSAGRLRLAATLNQLAVLLHSRERYAEAEQSCREALAIRRAELGPEHPDVTSSMGNLAALLKARGALDEAEQLHREVLAVELRTLGPRHPSNAETMSSLAAILRREGRLEEAEPLYREALAIDRAAYGEDHPDVTTKLNNLAALLRSKGDYGEAARLLAEVVERDRRQRGDDHPYVGMSLDSLAGVLVELGRPAEALPLYDEAGRILAASGGADSPRVAANLVGRAAALRAQGSAARAVPLLDRALEIYRREAGGDRLPEATALTELGEVMAALGSVAAAERAFRSAVELRRAHNALAQPDSVALLTGLGRALLAGGRIEDARTQLQQALEVADTALPGAHWRRLDAELALAEACAATGDDAAAAHLSAAVGEALAGRVGYHEDRLRGRLEQIDRRPRTTTGALPPRGGVAE